MRVYVTRRVPQPGIDKLKQCCEVKSWFDDEKIPHEELVKNLKTVQPHALFCLLTDTINEEVLAAAGWYSVFTALTYAPARVLRSYLLPETHLGDTIQPHQPPPIIQPDCPYTPHGLPLYLIHTYIHPVLHRTQVR